MEDGVYYDISEDDYHAIPRLSASGVKDMRISPATFWARSWMNTQRETDVEEKKHLLKGRAYHARICEGRNLFAERYTFEHDPADYPHALIKQDDLKARCKEYGLAVGGTKDALSRRIIDHEDENDIEPRSLIWDMHVAEVRAAHEGRTFLPADWLHDFETGAAYVEKHPVISQVFQGGKPEVTILWTHTLEDGREVKMKTRVDYLKKQIIADYKTFANPLDMEPSRAIIRAIANYRYWLQAAVYYNAVDYAVDQGWIEKPDEPHKFMFVFQGTGEDRNPRARIFPRESMYIDLGWRHLALAAQSYLDCLEHFGEDVPWYNDEPIEVFADDDFPMWMGG